MGEACWLMRNLVWVAIALACMVLLAPVALADGGMVNEPQRLTEATIQDLALLLDSDSEPVVVWEELAADDAGAMERRVVLWQGASEEGSILAQRPISESLAVHLLPSEGGRYVGWSQTTTRTMTVQRIDTQGSDLPLSIALPQAHRHAEALDAQGHVHAVWAEGDRLLYVNTRQAITLTVPLTNVLDVDQLELLADSTGLAHAVWQTVDAQGAPANLYYAPVVSGTMGTLIAARSQSPQMALDGDGVAHLVWRDEQGWVYANGVDWTALTRLDAITADRLALAAGPDGEAYVIWSQDDGLYSACSLDWDSRWQVAQVLEPLKVISSAVDGCNGLHLAWVERQDGQAVAAIYLAPNGNEAQLQAWLVDGPPGDASAMAVAETNLAPGGLDHVAFYLQRDRGQGNAIPIDLIALGVDDSERDGWSVTFDRSGLDYGRYRVYAIAATNQGQLVRAGGEWFTAPDAMVWLTRPTTQDGALSREAFIEVCVATGQPLPARIGLYLAALRAQDQVASLDLGQLLAAPNFVGSYVPADVRVEQGVYRLPFDSRQVPDGRYVAVLVLGDVEEKPTYVPLAPALWIDNAILPTISLRAPTGGEIVSGEPAFSATAQDRDGAVEQVAFYLEREMCNDVNVPDAWRRVWLGLDDDSSDGWGLLVPVDSAWEGGRWRVRAQAFDDQGHVSEALSAEPFSVLASDSPVVSVVEPQPGQLLWGDSEVILRVERNASQLEALALYLVADGGTLLPLGQAVSEQESGRWAIRFDTTRFADGAYGLLVMVSGGSGSIGLPTIPLRIDNAPQLLVGGAQSPGALGPGPVLVSLAGTPEHVFEAQFWLEGLDGRVYPLGSDSEAADGFSLLFRPRQWLDGEYKLLARLESEGGEAKWLQREITLRSDTPQIRLTQRPVGRGLDGSQSLNWSASHPDAASIAVDLALSCDDGGHWMPIASGLAAEGPWRWSTTPWPDTPLARIRLTASDGLHQAEVISPRFGLSNRNSAPWGGLQSPVTGGTYAQSLHVAWRVGDAETLSALDVAIDWRKGQGSWQSLYQGLEVEGARDWDVSGLDPGDDYSLRLRITDPEGAAAIDLAEDITIGANRSPSVRLLWPVGRVILDDEVVILWQANDPDGDVLAIDLYYSYDAGYTWFPLAEGVPNTGYFEWLLSFLPASDQYRLRVVARDALSQGSDSSREVMSAGRRMPQYITLGKPQEGAVLVGRQQLCWQSRAGVGAAVEIEVREVDGDLERGLAAQAGCCGVLVWDTAEVPDGRYELVATVSDDSGQKSRITRQVTVANDEGAVSLIALQSPREGALLEGRHLVSWWLGSASTAAMTATCEVREVGTDIWTPVGQAPAAEGRLIWDASQVPSNALYDLRISCAQGDARDQVLTFVGRSSGMPPVLDVVSPDETGTLLRGDTLTWLSDDPDGDSLSLDLLARQQDQVNWRAVQSGLYDAGELRLGSGLLEDGEDTLEMVAHDAVYGLAVTLPLSLDPGSVEQAPTLSVLQPTRWNMASGTVRIAWEARDPYGAIPRVHIDLSGDGASSWQVLARNLDSSGSFEWDSTQWPNGGYYVRFTADNGRQDSRVIRGPFSVTNPSNQAPVVSLLSPQGGERWEGHRQTVWSGYDADGDALSYTLAYRVEGDRLWRTLASRLNAESYLLDSSVLPNAQRLWLRVTASDGTFLGSAQTAAPLEIDNTRLTTVRLLSPTAGQLVADEMGIVWEATRGDVSLAYRLAGDSLWRPIADDLEASGSYTWSLEGVAAQSRVELMVTARFGGDTVRDAMDAPCIVLRGASLSDMPRWMR